MMKYIDFPSFDGRELHFHAPGGAVERGSQVAVTIHSWRLLDDFANQREPDGRTVAVFDGSFDLMQPEEALASHAFSPLLGGSVVAIAGTGESLDAIKAAKNAEINAARLRANQSHFTFAGKQIAVDPLSRSDIDAAHGAILMLGAMPGGWPGGWKAMDNTIIPIPDLATWGQFYGAMVAQGTANFTHAQTLKAQLAAATTPAEVEAVPVW